MPTNRIPDKAIVVPGGRNRPEDVYRGIGKVFADFHNADERGRLRLNCIGTVEDLSQKNIELQDGQILTLYSEDLEVEGIVSYSHEESIWVAAIDWDEFRETEDVAVQAQASIQTF